MCRGPHEWSIEELEFNIQQIVKWLDSGKLKTEQDLHFWKGRVEMMEKLLKERAEKGMYA